ncbi:MAG: WD40 repeat domain-containing protein [Anaerolineae bacterium]|nr:WD40 repeat domain-containing protein [Anaerolineae bacterium]
MIRLIQSLLLLGLFCIGGSLTAQSDSFVRAFPTYCHGFDPTGRYVITDSGTYHIETGEKFFPTTDGETLPVFSNGGHLVAFLNRVYDAETLELLFETQMPVISFSPDDQFAADAETVYAVAEGERLFAYEDTQPEFSPDSRLFMALGDAVYDLATGEPLYAIWGDDPVFSPDSQYIGTNLPDMGYVVMDANSGDVLLTIKAANYFPINLMGFSHHGKWVYIPYDHVYEIATGNRVVTFEETTSSGYFSKNDDFLVLFNGLYDTITWERLVTGTRWIHPSGTIVMDRVTEVYHAPTRSVLFTVDYPIGYLEFSTDGQFIVTSNGVYDIEAQDKIVDLELATLPDAGDQLAHVSLSPTSDLLLVRISYSGCLIYDHQETDWPQTYGILMTQNDTNIRNAPSPQGSIKASDIYSKIYIVTGISSDGNWYRILLDDDASWVAAERVTVLYDTGRIPIVE